MTVNELKFKSFKSRGGQVKACLLTEEVQVPTAGGTTLAHPGQYVAVIGTTEIENHGPHKDGTFETRKEKAPLYGIFTTEEFEFLYSASGKDGPEGAAAQQ